MVKCPSVNCVKTLFSWTTSNNKKKFLSCRLAISSDIPIDSHSDSVNVTLSNLIQDKRGTLFYNNVKLLPQQPTRIIDIWYFFKLGLCFFLTIFFWLKIASLMWTLLLLIEHMICCIRSPSDSLLSIQLQNVFSTIIYSGYSLGVVTLWHHIFRAYSSCGIVLPRHHVSNQMWFRPITLCVPYRHVFLNSQSYFHSRAYSFFWGSQKTIIFLNR